MCWLQVPVRRWQRLYQLHVDTHVRCALGKNAALLDDHDEPFAWALDGLDKWPPTMNGRCERYAPGVYIVLDPDRDIDLSEESQDQEQIDAIRAADGR